MSKISIRKLIFVQLTLVLTAAFLLQQPVTATPFGQGVYGANNAFGSLTSMSLSLGGDVNIMLTPSGGNYSGNGSGAVTVTTNDAVGYRLYILSPSSTSMTLNGGGDSIPASSNSSPAALATNTWGYNTTGSTTNFTGILTTPTVIKDANGPYESGDTTTVTYGVLTDATKSAGTYSANVVYTVVPKFE